MPLAHSAIRRNALASAALLIAACTAPDSADDIAPDTSTAAAVPARGPAPLAAVAGTLRTHDGMLHFARCGTSGDGDSLEDGTGGDAAMIVSELGPDNGVTALVELDNNRLVAVHYAAPEGASCEELPPAAEIEARGQEPFWFVSLSGDVATVRTPEELDGVQYSGGRWSVIDGTHWRYDAARGGEALVLELSLERCADAMSGARYPLKATLTRNGAAMQGCALPGRGAP
jgi:uncharacterized membrane protein